jgi:hypothetical protein
MNPLTISCNACGGAVAHPAGEPLPRCLFCDSEALVPVEAPEIEAPETWLPFGIDESEATVAFKTWTRSSIWYPSDLRHAAIELHRLMLPAWSWDGRIETHWAALVSAMTQSGKRPLSGQDSASYQGVLVPSSTALSRNELASISPFNLGPAKNVASEAPMETYELGGLTRRGARAGALDQMRQRHAAEIRSRINSLRLNISTLDHEMEGRPLLLPVFIGAFRRGDKIYRVVINGQTGMLTGTAPLSWIKISLAVAGVLALIVLLLLFLNS